MTTASATPRVWRHGDEEPGMPVVAVRDSNGRLWVRAHARDMWTHARSDGGEGWAASHCFWSLVTLEGSPVTEVASEEAL